MPPTRSVSDERALQLGRLVGLLAWRSRLLYWRRFVVDEAQARWLAGAAEPAIVVVDDGSAAPDPGSEGEELARAIVRFLGGRQLERDLARTIAPRRHWFRRSRYWSLRGRVR